MTMMEGRLPNCVAEEQRHYHEEVEEPTASEMLEMSLFGDFKQTRMYGTGLPIRKVAEIIKRAWHESEVRALIEELKGRK